MLLKERVNGAQKPQKAKFVQLQSVGERRTWKRIQADFPNQWVLMRDVEIKSGNLVSAVVIYAASKRSCISKFRMQNPNKVSGHVSARYTGKVEVS